MIAIIEYIYGKNKTPIKYFETQMCNSSVSSFIYYYYSKRKRIKSFLFLDYSNSSDAKNLEELSLSY